MTNGIAKDITKRKEQCACACARAQVKNLFRFKLLLLFALLLLLLHTFSPTLSSSFHDFFSVTIEKIPQKT